MSDTRADIDRSIDATRAELAKLSPAQLDQVLVKTHDALLDFIEREWLNQPLTPREQAQRRAAERFHASVRVHDFSKWRAA